LRTVGQGLAGAKHLEPATRDEQLAVVVLDPELDQADAGGDVDVQHRHVGDEVEGVRLVIDRHLVAEHTPAHDPIPSVWASRSRMVTATSADGGQGQR
jgi:hypothetical protein